MPARQDLDFIKSWFLSQSAQAELVVHAVAPWESKSVLPFGKLRANGKLSNTRIAESRLGHGLLSGVTRYTDETTCVHL